MILQIRDIPEHLYRKLQEQAKIEHRSLAQQAVVTLAKGMNVELDFKVRRGELIKKILNTKIPSSKKKLRDPVDLIREDRER